MPERTRTHTRRWLRFAVMILAFFLAVSPPAGAQEVVTSVLDARNADLEQDRGQLDQIRKRTAEERTALNRDLSALDKRHEVLLARRRLVAHNPRELQDLVVLYKALRKDLVQRMAATRAGDRSLQGIEERASHLQKSARDTLPDAQDAETRKFLATVLSTAAKVEREAKTQRTLLASPIRKADELDKAIAESQQEVTQELPSAWNTYFLVPQREYTTLAGWRILWNRTVSRIHDIRTTFVPDSGLRRDNFLPFLAKVIGSSFAFLLLGWAALRNVRRKWPNFLPPRVHAPMGWVALGVGTLAALLLSPDVHLAPLATLARVLLLLGAVQAVRRFRRRASDGLEVRGALGVLWMGYVVSEVVNLLAVPGGVVSLLAPVALIPAALALHRRSSRIQASVERKIVVLSSWMAGLLAVASILGWGNAVLLAIPMWFVACLLLMWGTVLHGLLAELNRQAPDSGMQAILAGVGLGLGYPTIWFGAVSTWLVTLASRIGRPSLYFDVLAYDIGIGKVSVSVLRIVGIVVLFFVSRAALAVARSVIQRAYASRDDSGPGAADSIVTVVVYVGWSLAVILALTILGLDMTSLAVVAGGLSVGIGFGMQNIVNNFVGGMILLVGRSVQRGDVIDIAGVHGVVQKVTIRNTIVQSYDNATLFVPNAQLVSERLTNWTHRDRRVRRELVVGVAYGSDTALVERLLLDAARRDYRVQLDPSPHVLFYDFGASSLEFRLRVWVDDYDHMLVVLSDLRKEVDRLFRQHGVEIAFPQQDIHVRSAPGLEEALVPRLVSNAQSVGTS